MLNDVVELTRIQLIDATDNTFTADNPHAFDAFTVTIPVDDGTVPNVALMIFVPWPVLIVAPPGTVHVYDDAPCTAATEYVKSVFNGLQIAVVPLIAPAPDGNALNVTVIELVAAVHGAVASVVNVNVTLPAA